MGLLDSWNTVRVHATWSEPDGSAMVPGTYAVTVPRLTNRTDDAIIAAGTYKGGSLNVTAGSPSLEIRVPATDDPDIEQADYKITITVQLNPTDGTRTTEIYVLDVPVALTDDAAGINLRTIALSSQIGPLVALYGVGVPGGLAQLSADGTSVLNADGDPIVGGAGGGGASTLGELTDVTTTGAASGQVLKFNGTEWAPAADATGSGGGTGAVTSVNGDTGTVVLSAADVGAATSAQGAKADSAVQPAAMTTAINAAVTNLVNGAPGALDTLKELADALGDDANYAATITAALAGKVPTSRTVNGHALSANVVLTAADVAAVSSDTTGITGATPITKMVKITAAAYAAIADIAATTYPGVMFVVVG